MPSPPLVPRHVPASSPQTSEPVVALTLPECCDSDGEVLRYDLDVVDRRPVGGRGVPSAERAAAGDLVAIELLNACGKPSVVVTRRPVVAAEELVAYT